MRREDLVKNIKNICMSKGINIRQMEEELEFSPGLISRWVRMSPSVEKIAAVADYLGVSLDSLVGRTVETRQNSFVEKIYNETKKEKLLWHPCGFASVFSYPINRLKELQGKNWQCGYCEFENGFLLLACSLEQEETIEDIGLYIVPDENAMPVFQDIDGDELLPLYDIIRKDIVWREDRNRAEKLKASFLDD